MRIVVGKIACARLFLRNSRRQNAMGSIRTPLHSGPTLSAAAFVATPQLSASRSTTSFVAAALGTMAFGLTAPEPKTEADVLSRLPRLPPPIRL